MMGWRFDAVLLVAALLLGQFGLFYLSAYRCEYTSAHAYPQSPDTLKALVVSDVHVLGKRRRVWVERLWTDMQVGSSLRAAVQVHQPDVVLVLGDQLDEGGYPTSDSDFESYVSRFKAAFASARSVETIYLLGNHDSAFGRFLTPAAIARHERAFGLSNSATTVKGHTIIRLNTMALDADVPNVEVQAQAYSFLETLTRESNHNQRADRSVILLSHLPLFRADDLACGAERVREQGHVTYEHPSFPYETHHHVLSDVLSQDLLAKLQPDVVLSGHTHAWCAFEHRDHPRSSTGTAVKEFTVPAFAWSQRPDPSYALLFVTGHDAHVARCALPREPTVFALFGVTLLILVTRLLWRGASILARTPFRLHHHEKKLK